jgi:hypothetical protein
MPGHFAGGYQVEALTCESSIACLCKRRGQQITYERRVRLGKAASASNNERQRHQFRSQARNVVRVAQKGPQHQGSLEDSLD